MRIAPDCDFICYTPSHAKSRQSEEKHFIAEYLASKLLIDCDHTLAKLVKDTLSRCVRHRKRVRHVAANSVRLRRQHVEVISTRD